MIIKSIFRRYERWNPVHPTSGAFWGVGLGIGCGVGWGPGFGPEVIGYVGAGCGVGFSVGITFLGIGIGLPANYLLQVPRSAFMLTRRGASEVARAGNLLGGSSFEGDVWGNVSSHISDPQHNLHSSFPRLKIQHWTEIMKSLLVFNARIMNAHLRRTGQRLFPQDKGSDRCSSYIVSSTHHATTK